MINQPLISIIVPVYNVEKYIYKCIDSIINQSLQNIEIILVNDGSTDNSGKIIDEYSKKDSRVISVHKENGGQSSARNKGLDIAKGKYIGFVDSDDWIEKDMYEVLYNCIEESKSDISVCGRQAYSESGVLSNKVNIEDEIFDFSKDSLHEYIVKRLFYKHTVVVWNKIYKSEIINNNNIRFKNVNYVGSEDALFNYSVLCHTQKIKSINKIKYNQLSREGSTARSYKRGYFERTGNLLKHMNEYSIKANKEQLANETLPIILLFFHQWNISQIKTYSNENVQKLIKEELKEGIKIKELAICTRKLAFNKSTSKDMENMGFKFKGKLLIRIIMILSTLKLYNISSKIIILK